MLNDVSRHLKNKTSFEINQEILGMRNLFRGIVVKSWIGNNFETSVDHEHNKSIVKESVKCCNECWLDRCNVLHDEEEQKKRLSQWNKNLFDEMKNEVSDERKYVENTESDLDRSNNEKIKAWMLGTIKMKSKLKKCPQFEIRRFFNGQR